MKNKLRWVWPALEIALVLSAIARFLVERRRQRRRPGGRATRWFQTPEYQRGRR